MGTDIASGRQVPTDEVPVHPIDASATPATLPAAVRVPVADGPATAGPLVGGVFDGQSFFADNAAQMTAEVAAAQTHAQDARDGLLAHYQAAVMPLGSPAIDEMVLPPVPANAVPPAMSDLYPYSGTEPTPADAGMAGPYPG